VPSELGGKPGLPSPGLATEQHTGRPTTSNGRERHFKIAKLSTAPDEDRTDQAGGHILQHATARRVLLEREGVSVAAGASSAAEALGLFKTLRPDVVLVDISLGEESGLELARRLADDGQGDRATVILISTHADGDADLIAASLAADFLPKTEVSAKTIREIVNRRAG
jgi:CheY-like chemotaxis protein